MVLALKFLFVNLAVNRLVGFFFFFVCSAQQVGTQINKEYLGICLLRMSS